MQISRVAATNVRSRSRATKSGGQPIDFHPFYDGDNLLTQDQARPRITFDWYVGQRENAVGP